MRKLPLAISLLTAVGLVVTGYAGHISPARHPALSLLGFVFPFFLAVNTVSLLLLGLMRSRTALVPLAALAAAWGPTRTYCPLNLPQEPPPGSIKVLSYNVMGFAVEVLDNVGPNPVIEYILGQDADIVCLQEYAWPGAQDSLRRVMEARYPYHVDSPSHGYAQRAGGGDHVAVFSRFPVLASHIFEIDTKGNTLAGYLLLVGRDTVCVVNGHLETNGLSVADKARFAHLAAGQTRGREAGREVRTLAGKLAEAARVRAPQADSIEHATSHARRHGSPVIVCGDLNDHPLSYAHRRAAEGLTDCYRETATGPGFTFHHHSMHFRIDNIFCSSHYRPYRCHVDRSIALSDHYPMVCWLKRQ